MQKLSNQQWWRKLCPRETIEFLRLPAQTTRAEAWANMLSKIAELERELADKSAQAPKQDVTFRVIFDDGPDEAIQKLVAKNVATGETPVTQTTRTPNVFDPLANRTPVIDIPTSRPQLSAHPKAVNEGKC